jgi:ATP-dependent Zn protease
VSLEEIKITQRTLSKYTNHGQSESTYTYYSNLKNFYEQPPIQLLKQQKAKPSLYSQFIKRLSTKTVKQANRQQTYSKQNNLKKRKSPGFYDSLQPSEDNTEEMTSEENDSRMEEDPPSTQERKGDKSTKSSRQIITKKWETNPSISQLSATFVTNLQVEQEKLLEAGEDLEDATKYKSPTDETEIQQVNKIRISIRKARNAESQPTLKLF